MPRDATTPLLHPYRPEIDGLRAVAVCAVILFHAGAAFVPGGYVGVDVFFVISGYLITSIITAEMDAGKFSIIRFYERRIRRILPALLVLLLMTSGAAWFVLPPAELQEYAQSLFATAIFISNLYFWLKTSYFATNTENLPLIHMWSLSVEEQFYTFFPLFITIFRKYKMFSLNKLMLSALLLSIVASLYETPHDQAMAFFLTPFRGWELLAGGVVSINGARWRPALAGRPRLTAGIELLAALAVLGPMLMFGRATVFPGGAAIVPVAGAAAILLVTDRRSPAGRVLSSRPLVGVGLISYSAYLWHQPIFSLARAIGVPQSSVFVMPFLVICDLVVAYFSWKCIETPFRRPGAFSRTQIFAAAGSLSLFLALAALLGQAEHGFPGRFNRATFAVEASAAASPLRVGCHAMGVDFLPPAKACRYFGGVAHWAVLGDSEGVEIAYALAEQLKPLHQSVLHLTFSGCPPALSFDPGVPGCRDWIGQSVALLERAPEINDVIVVFRHSTYLFGPLTAAYPRQPNMQPSFLPALSPRRARAAYLASFSELVRRLSLAGKRIYLVEPVPDLPNDVRHYIFRPAIPGLPIFDTGVSSKFYRARSKFMTDYMISLLSNPNVTLLDPSSTVCANGQCFAISNGVALYYDDSHLSLEGARRFIARQLSSGTLTLSPPQGGPALKLASLRRQGKAHRRIDYRFVPQLDSIAPLPQ